MTRKRTRKEQQMQDKMERRKFRKANHPDLAILELQKHREQYRQYTLQRKELKMNCLRIFNQSINIRDICDEERKVLKELSSLYAADVEKFEGDINPTVCTCTVCGLASLAILMNTFEMDEDIFNPLRVKEEDVSGSWRGYFSSKGASESVVCKKCLASLKKREVPKLSRVNIPLANPSATLTSLSYLETLLVSPVLPITYAWQHRSYGQFKSKGQCVAFLNNLSDIATALPRHPSDIIINVESVYGWSEKVRIDCIRKAFYELKFVYRHPAFADIVYSEENSKAIEEVNNQHERNQGLRTSQDSIHRWSNVFVDRGQNQCMEDEVASQLLEVPLSLHEDQTSQEVFKEKVIALFDSLRSYSRPLHFPDKMAEWPYLFPTLMPDGNGGPIGEFIGITVKEWVEYVIQLVDLHFHSNIPFIFYSNFILRKQRITGVSACKPIAKSVAAAITELVRIAKEEKGSLCTPRSTISYLANQVSFHTNALPVSVGDMSQFRKNILSMMSKHGKPTFFLTLSSADTMWPETYVFISGFRMSEDEAKKLSPKERAELIARNPVRTTIAWKARLQAILNFICKGKTKPFGEIKHYAIKAEWQTRCSEHAHILLWSDACIPELQKSYDIDGNEIAGDNSELLRRAEQYQSAWVPCETEDDVNDDADQDVTSATVAEQVLNSDKTSSKVDIIQQRPIKDILSEVKGSEFTKDLQELVYATQLHRCNRYCTNNYTKACKSHFPFHKNANSELYEISTSTNTSEYRVRLRRNHSRVNCFNVFVLNLWRANMDISTVVGDAFGAVVYIALYTSKVDRKADISDVLQKLTNLRSDQSIATQVRKALLAMDSNKATGAPEAASNLLGYPHWKISSTVYRISTLPYLNNTSGDSIQGQNSLKDLDSVDISSTFHEMDANKSIFQLPEYMKKEKVSSKAYRLSPHCAEYFARPTELEQYSLKTYVETFRASRKKQCGHGEHRNKEGKVIVKRVSRLENDVILDLQYRVSPPDPCDERWCVGAVMLHIPHRSPIHLLSGYDSFEGAYQFFINEKDRNGLPKYNDLHSYENQESQLYATKTTARRPRKGTSNPGTGLPTDHRESDISHGDRDAQATDCRDTVDSDEDEAMACEDTSDKMIENDSDFERKKKWNGRIDTKFLNNLFLTRTVSHDEINSSCELKGKHFDIDSALEHHIPYLQKILSGETATELANLNENRIPQNDPDIYLCEVIRECKTDGQRFAFNTISKVVDEYYFGPKKDVELPLLHSKLPFISMVGVPGSGKSWIISKIKRWIHMKIPRARKSYHSTQDIICGTGDNIDTVSAYLSVVLASRNKTSYGKSPCVAFSGAAAGVIKGHTIHKALGFSRGELSRRVLTGLDCLPPLSPQKRDKLYSYWREAKVIIIDEVYAIDAGMLYIIDIRLRQIFNVPKPFGGLVVIIAGDPRQIVPVVGRALFYINMYFPQSNDSEEVRRKKEMLRSKDNVSLAEWQGYKLLSLFQFHIPLNESVRLGSDQYAALNKAAASYTLSNSDVAKYNDWFYKPHSSLYTSLWVDSIWLFPSWRLVNDHLKIVNEYMAKTRGVFRIWSRIQVPNRTSPMSNGSVQISRMKKALHTFLTRKILIGPSFEIYPYIDIFPGQILNLKRNWNPSEQFFTHSKVVVLGVHVTGDANPNPCLSVSDIIDLVLQGNGVPKYELLVKHLTGTFLDLLHIRNIQEFLWFLAHPSEF